MRLADQVLHAPQPAGADLVLIFGRYHRHTDALFSPLRFKIRLALEKILAHVWSLETTQAVVGSSYLIFDIAPDTADGSNLSQYWAAVWATHPDLILGEVGWVFLEPEQSLGERALPFFIPTSEIIHSKRDTL
jgi:hypothetical protein